MGTPFAHVKWFRGRETTRRGASTCPDPGCCRRAPDALAAKWQGRARPQARIHASLLATLPTESFPGVDHFVLALGASGESIRLHDPAGFAHALIGSAELAAAWNAQAIAYRRGHCRYWTRPRREREVDDIDLHRQAMARFRALHAEAKALAGGDPIDGALIRRWATLAKDDSFDAAQLGHLTRFALPLGVKRALDFAAFFDGRESELAALKRRQAVAFGACHSHVMALDAAAAGACLLELADIEDEIGGHLAG